MVSLVTRYGELLITMQWHREFNVFYRVWPQVTSLNICPALLAGDPAAQATSVFLLLLRHPVILLPQCPCSCNGLSLECSVHARPHRSCAGGPCSKATSAGSYLDSRHSTNTPLSLLNPLCSQYLGLCTIITSIPWFIHLLFHYPTKKKLNSMRKFNSGVYYYFCLYISVHYTILSYSNKPHMFQLKKIWSVARTGWPCHLKRRGQWAQCFPSSSSHPTHWQRILHQVS